MNDDTDSYFETRLPYDARRRALWRTLVQHEFQNYVPQDGAVLELGAGYCDFINEIDAPNKYALDIWQGTIAHAAPDVTTIVGDVTAIGQLADDSLDLIFA